MENVNYLFLSGMKQENGTVVAFVEGWTHNETPYTVQQVEVKGETKKVARMNLNAQIADSKVKFLFGEEFLNEKHRIYIDATFWDYAAENIERYAPTIRQRIGVFGTIKVQEYTKKDGTIGKKLVMNATDFKPLTKKFEGEVPASAVPSQPVQAMQAQTQALPVIGDDDLPF